MNLHHEPSQKSNARKELIGIIAVISIIFFIWVFYPNFLKIMDKYPTAEPKQIVIPYKLDAQPTTDLTEEKQSKLQTIGEQYAAYGDSYGSLNTLFSGLAFAILIISMFMQREELKAQRNELQAQRTEIQESNKIAEGQRIITEQQASLIQEQINEAKKQNFYSLFFQFLNEKNIKFHNLKIKSRNPSFPDLTGDLYVQRFSNDLLNALDEPHIPPIPSDNGDMPTELEQLKMRLEYTYNTTCERNRTSFEEHFYFEYFVFILNFIRQNSSVHNSEVVIDTFLSRLNFNETICMACYAILRNDELKDYIEKYGLLKNIRPQLLENEKFKALMLLYSKKAFTPPKNATVDFLFNNLN